MKKSKKQQVSNLIAIGVGIVLGVIIAFLDIPFPTLSFTSLCFLVLFFLLSLTLQIAIHEAGHLVCGLLSGYRFCSYRLGGLLLSRQEGHLKLKLTGGLAGISGQCLMRPPADCMGKDYPVILYNLGGVLANSILSVLAVLLMLFLPLSAYGFLFWGEFVLLGVLLALTNGIPSRTAFVANDGANIISLQEDPSARSAFWKQLEINYYVTEGYRLSHVANDLFLPLPDDTALKNPLHQSVAVNYCARLMDEHRFQEAQSYMEHLLWLDPSVSLLGFYRCELLCNLLYIELIGSRHPAIIASITEDKFYLQFCKMMANSISVIRTQYTLALWSGNTAHADKLKKRFEKLSRHPAAVGDLQSEKEFLAIAEAQLLPQS